MYHADTAFRLDKERVRDLHAQADKERMLRAHGRGYRKVLAKRLRYVADWLEPEQASPASL